MPASMEIWQNRYLNYHHLVAEFINLSDEHVDDSVEIVVGCLRRGEIAVLPSENAYIYAADAFIHSAVNEIHLLRGDAPGVAAQVFVEGVKTLKGLSSDFDEEYKVLAEKFWPGLLTLQLKPHHALNWDLGDGGDLAEFAVRSPAVPFLARVLELTGPLAIASATMAGEPPLREIESVPALASDIGVFVDAGTLPETPATTVIRRAIVGVGGGLEVAREGAISFEAIQEILPTIARPEPLA